MPAFKHPTFSDRLTRAADAKAALVETYKARPGPDDPRVMAQAAERLKVHEDRIARETERQRAKDEAALRDAEARQAKVEQEREAALERQLRAEADAEAAQLARRERLAAKSSNLADQKVLRDTRYAARKARQKR